MVKERNLIKMGNWNLKGNIYMVIEEKEKNMFKKDQNMKENIYFIINGAEKVMMKMEMLFMN